MKLLAIEVENNGVDANHYKPHLLAESIKVLELYEKGLIREIYFDQLHCAVIIIESESIEEAEEELSKLPLVSNGLIHFEIRVLNPYTGFSRLLD